MDVCRPWEEVRRARVRRAGGIVRRSNQNFVRPNGSHGGSKFDSLTIPVLLWEASNADDMKFQEANGDAPAGLTQINIVDASTPLTAGLPAGLLSDLKSLANKMDVPYQSLLKVLLSESIERERGDGRRKTMPNMRMHLTNGPAWFPLLGWYPWPVRR